MAKLISSRTNGKNCRHVEEWERPLESVSRGNVGGLKLGLSFPSGVDRYDEASKARDYQLTLDEADAFKILRTIFGDAGQGLTSEFFGERKHDRLGEPLLERLGIRLNSYRVPAKGFSAFQTHYYVRAVNEHHAIVQLSRLFKNPEAFDATAVELIPQEGTD